MTRQIKFRGRRVKDGGFVYGDYCIGLHGYPSIRDHETKQYVDVNPDTVAQFIGYDSHGNEVYEGDKLTDSNNNKYIAKLDSVVDWSSPRTLVFRRAPLDFAKEFVDFTVEAANNDQAD